MDSKSKYGIAIVDARETFDFEEMVQEFLDASIEYARDYSSTFGGLIIRR